MGMRNKSIQRSSRAPGDKDPGVIVVLEIDGTTLNSTRIGTDRTLLPCRRRVARDISERFIRFLATRGRVPANVPAVRIGGVTAMQYGGLRPKETPPRKAADDAARRKDGEAR